MTSRSSIGICPDCGRSLFIDPDFCPFCEDDDDEPFLDEEMYKGMGFGHPEELIIPGS
jgi:hypothetical protein